ncbi:sensory histidine kinase DcuS [compost metagenome]
MQGFSTKGEGRGFGLYLVCKSVEKLGGRLEVLSQGVDGTNGTGTTFIVEVPYAVKDEESI